MTALYRDFHLSGLDREVMSMNELIPEYLINEDDEMISAITSTDTVLLGDGSSLSARGLFSKDFAGLPIGISDLPYCCGTFLDRSFLPNDTNILTPAADIAGNAALIQGGNRFTADSGGLWACFMSGGLLPSPRRWTRRHPLRFGKTP